MKVFTTPIEILHLLTSRTGGKALENCKPLRGAKTNIGDTGGAARKDPLPHRNPPGTENRGAERIS